MTMALGPGFLLLSYDTRLEDDSHSTEIRLYSIESLKELWRPLSAFDVAIRTHAPTLSSLVQFLTPSTRLPIGEMHVTRNPLQDYSYKLTTVAAHLAIMVAVRYHLTFTPRNKRSPLSSSPVATIRLFKEFNFSYGSSYTFEEGESALVFYPLNSTAQDKRQKIPVSDLTDLLYADSTKTAALLMYKTHVLVSYYV
ncbi:hypothetical protein C8R43DRAFT_1103478 [Mycena crocata]|nr:hypothetical protein C8R43DRAFT_1103478 [Mycena crocata]